MATFQKRSGKVRAQVRKEGIYVCRTFTHMTDAKRWATQQEAAIERGDVPARRRELQTIRLSELITRYEKEVTSGKKGRETEKYRLKILGSSPIASKVLAYLSPQDIAQWRDSRLSEVSPGTVRRDLALLRRVLEVARTEWGLPMANNPVTAIRLPSEPPARTRRLNAGEWDRLLEKASPVMSAAIRLLLYTGMRRSELVAATWDNVDLQGRTLRLVTSKTGEGRFVPLSSAAIEVLQGLPCAGIGQPIIPLSCNAIRLAWQRLKKRAGITGLRMHDLRREAASRAFEKGLGIESVMVLTGHKTAGILLKHYTALKASEVAGKLD